MERRQAVMTISALGAAAVAGVAFGQAALHRVGYLGPSMETAPRLPIAFQEGLASMGYVEGRNLVIHHRWTNAGRSMNSDASLLASARELVDLKVAVIAASIDPAIIAASRATKSIPIVMLNVSDPVELGLVASLAHPGGNITGFTRLSPELVGKNLQILLEIVPKMRRVGLLVSSVNSTRTIVRSAQEAALALGIALQLVEANGESALEAAFATLKRGGAEGLVVSDTGGGVFFTQRVRLTELALAHQLPAIYANTEIVESGGLISYSPSAIVNYRRAGAIVDKILRGMKPSNIPVEQPTTFELAINMKTARAMQLAMPPSLLVGADIKIDG